MMTICRQFEFCASHQLLQMPEEHKCRRHHGHNYTVEIRLQGVPNSLGMVADFADMDAAWKPIHAMLDHYHLNDIEGLEVPTAENICLFILNGVVDALPLLHSVRVYEGPKSWAEALRWCQPEVRP